MDLLGLHITAWGLIKEAVQLLVVYVLIRRYVVRDIETELDKRNIMRDGFFHAVVSTFVRYRQIWIQEWNSVKTSFQAR